MIYVNEERRRVVWPGVGEMDLMLYAIPHVPHPPHRHVAGWLLSLDPEKLPRGRDLRVLRVRLG